MSNMTTGSKKELANVDALLAQKAAAILDHVKGSGKFISLNNRQFNMPGGEVINGPLDLVVLDYVYQFRYYPDAYNAGGSNKPAECYSIGESESSMVIGEDVPHPVHTDCNSCPNNQWGSAGNGRKGKACGNNIMLAVMLPDLEESQDVMVIKASPAAITGVKQYLNNATRLYGHPLKAITTASIVPSGSSFKLQLESGGENPAYAAHAQYLDAAHDAVRTPPSVGVPEEIPFEDDQKVKRARA